MDAVLEQWYNENLDEDIQKNRTDFLDNFELDLAKKLSDKVLIGFTRHIPGVDVNVSSIVSHYADRLLQRKGSPNTYFVYSFCVQLYLMSQDPSFTPFEKGMLLKLIKRCAMYVNSRTAPQPEDQDDCLQIDDECQIEEMKNWTKRQKSIYTKGDTTSPLYEFRLNLPSYDNRVDHEAIMRSALEEGKKILSDPGTIAMLAEIKRKTDSDPSREYGFEGFHEGKIHRNTKKELQPILGKNVLSLKSEYANGENTLFHAHPSISTLSLNNGTNGGDLVHAYEADKKVFAINKNGDIFYTNPELAGNCLINMNQPVGCPKSIGQVYVGNIKDFMK